MQFWQSQIYFDPNQESDALPFGAFVQNLRVFTPGESGGNLVTSSEEASYDFAAGLRGTAFNDRFDWDVTLSHSEYETDTSTPRFLANPLQDFFLGEQQGFDPYFDFYPVYETNTDRLFRPLSTAEFASLNTQLEGHAESSVSQFNVVFSGDLFDLPAGAVGMAAVLEAAEQEYTLSPDPRTLPTYTGTDVIYNYSDTGGGGDRTRSAVGVEFSVPLHTTLKASLAGRYDRYDDDSSIEGASTWQVGLEWRPTDSLLIRGSHNTSFRAPDMHYIYADESGYYLTITDEYRCRRDGFDPTAENTECGDIDYTYSTAGLRSGSTALKAETGKSSTIGLVWDIVDNMAFSLDYYDIELKDAVSDISSAQIFRNEADCRLGETRDGQPVDTNSALCQFYLGLVERSGTTPPNDNEVVEFRLFPINQAVNRTTGVDASWRYTLDTDRMGQFTVNLGWTHVLSLDYQEFAGDELLDIRDNLRYFNFRSRMSGSVVWAKDDWTTAVYATRWGSLPNWEETGRIQPHMLYNVNVSRKLSDELTVGLFVNNVLDTIHPKDDSFNTYPYFSGAFSPVGREVFLQFDFKFN